jgi:GNAT superfamily N-acetyltransferase
VAGFPLPPGYEISTDPRRIDAGFVHRYLSEESYWARGATRETVERAVANSMCFGLYGPDGAQVGFARVTTDRATFGYLSDVFVVPAHAGKGLGKALMSAVVGHPDLQGLRRFLLATKDAHKLYEQFGFEPLSAPDRFMEILDPAVRQRLRGS